MPTCPRYQGGDVRMILGKEQKGDVLKYEEITDD